MAQSVATPVARPQRPRERKPAGAFPHAFAHAFERALSNGVRVSKPIADAIVHGLNQRGI